MKRLLLATHAETDWSAHGRFQGHADVPLSERGRRQAEQMRRLLIHPADVVFTSDLLRARQTAEIVACSQAVLLDRRLRELNFGAWEGRTWTETEKADAAALAAWQADPRAVAPPGGERLSDLAERLGACRDDLLVRPEASSLIVGHRGALRVFICLLLGRPIERHWDFRLEVASVSEVLWQDGPATLTRLNDKA